MTVGGFTDLDPFDLPDWLAGDDVVWESDSGLRTGHRIAGVFRNGRDDRLPCALLAIDEAYPSQVAPDAVRHAGHQAWHHGQVLVVEHEATVTLAVPGRRFNADLVMEALARFARAVGASSEEWSVLLRIGSARR